MTPTPTPTPKPYQPTNNNIPHPSSPLSTTLSSNMLTSSDDREAPIIVAYQGELGSFSEQATLQFHCLHFPGRSISFVPCATFRDMFDALSSGCATRLSVPIENSLAGTIHENLDLLLRTRDAEIVGEFDLDVRNCLLALPKMQISDIKTVHSHPMALAQCKAFLNRHCLASKVGYDTAGCAKAIAKEGYVGLREGNAAIASAHAAKIYNLEIIERNVQDEIHNYTRFLFVANKNFKQTAEHRCDDGMKHGVKKKYEDGHGVKLKTSIAFSLINQPGILSRALSVFTVSNIDLSKIESRQVHTVRRAIGEDADSDCNERR